MREILIPRSIILDQNLKGIEKVLMGILFSYTNLHDLEKLGLVKIELKIMCQITGLSDKKVLKKIINFKQRGYLKALYIHKDMEKIKYWL
jgi:hypothetical protein